MAIYKFSPASPRAMFTNPAKRHTSVRAGESVDCSADFAASINAAYKGIDGAPAMSLLNPPLPETIVLDPPKVAPKRRKSRKSKAED